jgi:hypothetical protein
MTPVSTSVAGGNPLDFDPFVMLLAIESMSE